ncbi:MAG: reverse transcriptase domain-containing protein, partial [Gammaproteobacteria bacterium]
RPRLKGRALLIRYADDFIIGCELEEDARRLMEVLPKRMGKYGLSLHPEKSRLVRFHRMLKDGPADPENGAFDFWVSLTIGGRVIEATGSSSGAP